MRITVKGRLAPGCAALLLLCTAGLSGAAEVVSVPTGTPGQAQGSAPGAKPEEIKPEALEPLFVRPLVTIEAGRNDLNPVWSPQGTFIAFERSTGDKKEIRITLPDGTEVQTVYYQMSGETEKKFFFPGVIEEASYNAGITWSPDESRFVYMSNGGEGNYDLYAQDLGEDKPSRLTDHKEKDGQANWSRAADRIVFVSGRTGNGDVYLLDLATRELTRLTQGGKPYLYPQWSPDGRKLVMMHGSNDNHNVILIGDITKPAETRKALTTWAFDDLRPVWSPDGKKIAFYSNYNLAGATNEWSLVVIASDGSDPTEGPGLAARIVASDVIPDVETGPAWMPDSSRIVFVKNDRHEYNPLYVTDLKQKTSAPIKTGTHMNHDVASSLDGTLAFRAQVNQWDQIYVMKLKP